eukprot:TRINITY_DN27684_c0_g2_i1.p1 TRINITY_DN27684_c0_g2~~TRINITY_DN27684_c0_g2_i1.p1  ORF type:complete len:335 (+),score=71.16 TRINITY_DN27684_c0_g2_i1:93-1097(+)
MALGRLAQTSRFTSRTFCRLGRSTLESPQAPSLLWLVACGGSGSLLVATWPHLGPGRGHTEGGCGSRRSSCLRRVDCSEADSQWSKTLIAAGCGCVILSLAAAASRRKDASQRYDTTMTADMTLVLSKTQVQSLVKPLGVQLLDSAQVSEVDMGLFGKDVDNSNASSKIFKQFLYRVQASGSTFEEGIVTAALPTASDSDEAVKNLLQLVDGNESGRISYAEYATLSVLLCVLTADGSAPLPNLNEVAVWLFGSLDLNFDEKVDREAWFGFCRVARSLGLLEAPPASATNARRWYREKAADAFRGMEDATGQLEVIPFAAWCRRSLNRAALFPR